MIMNMQQVYDQMKFALNYFGLRFSEMDKVNVEIKENSVIFTYDIHTIILRNE